MKANVPSIHLGGFCRHPASAAVAYPVNYSRESHLGCLTRLAVMAEA